MKTTNEQINEVLRIAGVEQLNEDINNNLRKSILLLAFVLCGCKISNIPLDDIKKDVPVICNSTKLEKAKIKVNDNGIDEKNVQSSQRFHIISELPNTGCKLEMYVDAIGSTKGYFKSEHSENFIMRVKNDQNSAIACQNVSMEQFEKFVNASKKCIKDVSRDAESYNEWYRDVELYPEEFAPHGYENNYKKVKKF